VHCIKDTLRKHVNSTKHKTAFERYKTKLEMDARVNRGLHDHFEEFPEDKGATVDPAVKLFRFWACATFMKGGVALDKSKHFRPLCIRAGTDTVVKKLMDPPAVSAAVAATHKAAMVTACEGAFKYLNDRLTGNCIDNYDCTQFYNVCRLVQIFNPPMAVEIGCTDDRVRELHSDIKPLAEHTCLSRLLIEFPAFMAAAKATDASRFNRKDIDEYTLNIMSWWANHLTDFPEWCKAAQIIFAFSANSAACERVFSLLKSMFGDQQASVLGDFLQGSLMLRYNKRDVG
jgi:hypothetical protein